MLHESHVNLPFPVNLLFMHLDPAILSLLLIIDLHLSTSIIIIIINIISVHFVTLSLSVSKKSRW